MEVFDFCPGLQVPETISPAPVGVTSMNGWTFSARPSVPYRRKFKVALYGLKWYLDVSGRFYDYTEDRKHNAHLLERFYAEHQTWKEFSWDHPHIGPLVVRFAEKVDVPAAIPNSGGLIDKFEVNLIEANPGF